MINFDWTSREEQTVAVYRTLQTKVVLNSIYIVQLYRHLININGSIALFFHWMVQNSSKSRPFPRMLLVPW
jgi:hypothetical protein